MSLEKFLAKVLDQFENNSIKFSGNTNFRGLSEWNSLTALMVIDMIDEQYNVSVNGDDIKSCNSLRELWDLVLSKSKSNTL